MYLNADVSTPTNAARNQVGTRRGCGNTAAAVAAAPPWDSTAWMSTLATPNDEDVNAPRDAAAWAVPIPQDPYFLAALLDGTASLPQYSPSAVACHTPDAAQLAFQLMNNLCVRHCDPELAFTIAKDALEAQFQRPLSDTVFQEIRASVGCTHPDKHVVFVSAADRHLVTFQTWWNIVQRN